jgi:hypothetical protein
MASRFRALEDGWYEWLDQPRRAVAVHVRVAARDDGRLHLSGLRLDGMVSAELLRSVPVGRIEAAANAELRAAAPDGPRRRPRARIAATLRSNAVRGYPDSFYQAVATTYRNLASTSPRPVADLATANEVPVSTAQRWVKEARRRGLLAPGHPGKAG